MEENTDVRKKGMHGFYANLLTKNIAMGGNVENAVSVFTAGSSRQNQVVSEDQAPRTRVSEGIEESHSSRGVAETTTAPVSTASVTSEPIDHFRDSSSSSATKAVAAKPTPVAVPEVNKTEDINSARERYLARKRKLQEESR